MFSWRHFLGPIESSQFQNLRVPNFTNFSGTFASVAIYIPKKRQKKKRQQNLQKNPERLSVFHSCVLVWEGKWTETYASIISKFNPPMGAWTSELQNCKEW